MRYTMVLGSIIIIITTMTIIIVIIIYIHIYNRLMYISYYFDLLFIIHVVHDQPILMWGFLVFPAI